MSMFKRKMLNDKSWKVFFRWVNFVSDVFFSLLFLFGFVLSWSVNDLFWTFCSFVFCLWFSLRVSSSVVFWFFALICFVSPVWCSPPYQSLRVCNLWSNDVSLYFRADDGGSRVSQVFVPVGVTFEFSDYFYSVGNDSGGTLFSYSLTNFNMQNELHILGNSAGNAPVGVLLSRPKAESLTIYFWSGFAMMIPMFGVAFINKLITKVTKHTAEI